MALAATELVGACTVNLDILSVRFGQRARVEDLAVHPRHRSRGTGKLLLAAAKVWARERGATHLESGEARADAHRFYRREGAGASSDVCERAGRDLRGGARRPTRRSCRMIASVSAAPGTT